MNNNRRLLLVRILALIVVIALSVFIFSIRDQAEELAVYGYPGIFLLSFLSYATVLLPAPGIAIVFTMAGVFHPAGVALTAGAGAALGEISGYLAGFSGRAIVEKSKRYDRLDGWMQRNGPITVLLLAIVPNPIFDLAGTTAGILKMPLLKFLFWCWLGETIKMLAIAYLGASSFDWFFASQ
ncbi:MAG: DedA family protein [Chloroflexi bacterium]|nr:MAG: DedA family protein [Chloroflexota bacterium]